MVAAAPAAAVVPLVFLARMNALALIPFAALFSMLSIGGLYATAAPPSWSSVMAGTS